MKREARNVPACMRFMMRCFASALMVVSCVLLSCKRDDMADQMKVKPYGESSFYADGAAARQLVPHTVSRADDVETPELEVGVGLNVLGRWQHPLAASVTFPFAITTADLRRGQQEFEIFCTPCHGEAGDGKGMIPERGFTRPSSYHSDRLRKAPPSYFYNVITNGLGAMYPYNDRIGSDDRWRIVAYIRALQLSQYAPVASLSVIDRSKLWGDH